MSHQLSTVLPLFLLEYFLQGLPDSQEAPQHLPAGVPPSPHLLMQPQHLPLRPAHHLQELGIGNRKNEI